MQLTWQYTHHIWPIVLAILTATSIAIYAWPRRQVPGATPLIAICCLVVMRSVGAAFVMLGTSEVQFILASQIILCVFIIAPAFYFYLGLEIYADRRVRLRKWTLLLLAEPIAVFCIWAVWGYDAALLEVVGVKQRGAVFLPVMDIKPAFKLHALYSFALLLASAILLAMVAVRSARSQRWHVAPLTAAAVMPLLTNILHLLDVHPRIYTPLGHTVMCLCIAYCLFRFRLLDVMPIARATVFHNMSAGMVVLDANDRVVEMNPAATTLLGPDIDRLQALPTNVRGQLADPSSLPGPPARQAITLQHESGRRFVEVWQSALSGGDGRAHGRLVELHDVTDREALEQQRQHYLEALEQTKQELERVDRMKARFFTHISHEFRTPLTLTLGPVNGVRRGHFGPVPAEALSQLDTAARNAKRALDLVEELLELAELDGGAVTVTSRRLPLEPLVRSVIALFDSTATLRGVRLLVESDDTAQMAEVDPVHLEKVLVNLVANALAASDTGDTITASIFTDAQARPTIRVTDTGIGIAPDELEQVFDRFHRIEHQDTPRTRGSGIGLALCRELMTLMGGALTANSVKGEWAEFTVTLKPAVDRACSGVAPDTDISRAPSDPGVEPAQTVAVTPVDTIEVERPAASDTPLIVIIDDNDDMRAYIRSSLGGHYQIVEAVDGEEGIALARELVPSVVVSDVMMPGLDGFDLCTALRQDPRTSHVVVVLLTARADASSRHKGWARGADDYITKPFDGVDLSARIDNLCAQRRRLAERIREPALGGGAGRTEVTSADLATLETRDQKLLVVLTRGVEERIADPDLRIDSLARLCAMSERQLRRKLRALTGESPNGFVRRLRLDHAASALQIGSSSVAEVAYASGFSSASYFSQCFRERFGMSPSEFVSSA
ncbi:MAG: histidine kinase N-terminal 7TM domain-containing protein [Pseudomonadota bacterium]